MEAVRNRKERVVIFFFWLMLAVVVVVAIVNLTVETKQENAQVGAASPQDVPMGEKIAEVIDFLKDNPDNIEALVALGDLYYDSNQLHEAIDVFNRAVKFEPQSVHIQNDLGMLYQKTGQYDMAIERFQAALKIDPSHLNSLLHIGIIYRYTKKDNKKALEIFEDIQSKNPDPEMSKMIIDEIERIKTEEGMGKN